MITAAHSNLSSTAAVGPLPGTSMAAPHVTGAIALALSLRRKPGKSQLNANQLKWALTRTCKASTGAHDPALDSAAWTSALSSSASKICHSDPIDGPLPSRRSRPPPRTEARQEGRRGRSAPSRVMAMKCPVHHRQCL
jgi:hypothetical protein